MNFVQRSRKITELLNYDEFFPTSLAVYKEFQYNNILKKAFFELITYILFDSPSEDFMIGNSKSDSSRLMAAALLMMVFILAVVIAGFHLLHKKQMTKTAHAQEIRQEEATVKIDSLDREEEDRIEDNDITLVIGEEKKSSKYDRTDKLSYTDSVRYTREDLEHLDKYGLRITRNEIFARHGRMFNDQELQKYFDGQPWYVARYSPAEFDDTCLNEIEVDNVNLILACEIEKGYQ